MGREILKIVQIPKSELLPEIYEKLKEEKSFSDTDETLDEFLVSPLILMDLVEDLSISENAYKQARQLIDETKKYNYIHVTSI